MLTVTSDDYLVADAEQNPSRRLDENFSPEQAMYALVAVDDQPVRAVCETVSNALITDREEFGVLDNAVWLSMAQCVC